MYNVLSKLRSLHLLLAGTTALILCGVGLFFLLNEVRDEGTYLDKGAELNTAAQALSTVHETESATDRLVQEEMGSLEAVQFDASPWGARQNLGTLTVANPGVRYASHIQLARDGNSESMIEVADSILNCANALSGSPHVEDRKNAAYELFENAYITQSEYDLRLSLIEECKSVADDLYKASKNSIDFSPVNVAREWREKAAEAGNSVAQLQRSINVTGDWKAAGQLLDELLPAQDYRVYYEAATLASRLRPRDGTDEAALNKWQYLGCSVHPECNTESMRSAFTSYYTPTEVAEILEFKTKYESGQIQVSFVELLQDRFGEEEIVNQTKWYYEESKRRLAAESSENG